MADTADHDDNPFVTLFCAHGDGVILTIGGVPSLADARACAARIGWTVQTALPSTDGVLVDVCPAHAEPSPTRAESCGAGHDPERISCEAATEITRLRAEVERLHDCLRHESDAHAAERGRLRTEVTRLRSRLAAHLTEDVSVTIEWSLQAPNGNVWELSPQSERHARSMQASEGGGTLVRRQVRKAATAWVPADVPLPAVPDGKDASVDEMEGHFVDANERMGEALVAIGMALGLPRPRVGVTWGAPEILARIAEAAPRVEDVPARLGDRVLDGGQWGTLVACKTCDGSGVLHQLDPDELAKLRVEPAKPVEDHHVDMWRWALLGLDDAPARPWCSTGEPPAPARPNRSEWVDADTWRDPDCIECGGEGAPCCEPPDAPHAVRTVWKGPDGKDQHGPWRSCTTCPPVTATGPSAAGRG